MKKTLAALAATMAMGASVYADYVWTGGDISSESWADESNWNHDGSTWNGSAAGPNTTGSDMWDPITISGKSGKLDKLDGWDLSLSLEDCNLVIDELSTLKTDAERTISIDEKSTLTINNFASYNHDGGSGTTFKVDGTLNITITQNWPLAGTAPAVILGANGTINISLAEDVTNATFSIGTLTLTSTAVNQTVTTAVVDGGTYSLVEKDLGLMTITGLVVGEDIFQNYAQWDPNHELSASAGWQDEYTYTLTQNADGHNILRYVVEGEAKAIPTTPEPATATLSLLALAGLAARRRRKN